MHGRVHPNWFFHDPLSSPGYTLVIHAHPIHVFAYQKLGLLVNHKHTLTHMYKHTVIHIHTHNTHAYTYLLSLLQYYDKSVMQKN